MSHSRSACHQGGLYVGATLLSGGKVFSAAGQALFNTQKGIKYLVVTRRVNVPQEVQTVYCTVVIVGAASINILNRATTIYSAVLANDTRLISEEDQSDSDSDDEEDDFQNSEVKWSKPRRVIRCIIFANVWIPAGISAFCSSANAYLGGVSSITYLGSIDDVDALSRGMQITIKGSSGFIATSSLYSNIAYNYPPAAENGEIFADFCVNPDYTYRDRWHKIRPYLYTAFWLSLDISSNAIFAFFSSMNTFDVVGLSSIVDPTLLMVLAGLSTWTAIIAYMFSTFAATHDRWQPRPAFWKGLSKAPPLGKFFYWLSFFIGLEDSIATGVGIMISIVISLPVILSFMVTINPDDWGLAIYAVLAGISRMASSQAFSVMYGLEKQIKKYYPEPFITAEQEHTLIQTGPAISPIRRGEHQNMLRDFSIPIDEDFKLDNPPGSSSPKLLPFRGSSSRSSSLGGDDDSSPRTVSNFDAIQINVDGRVSTVPLNSSSPSSSNGKGAAHYGSTNVTLQTRNNLFEENRRRRHKLLKELEAQKRREERQDVALILQ